MNEQEALLIHQLGGRAGGWHSKKPKRLVVQGRIATFLRNNAASLLRPDLVEDRGVIFCLPCKRVWNEHLREPPLSLDDQLRQSFEVAPDQAGLIEILGQPQIVGDIAGFEAVCIFMSCYMCHKRIRMEYV